MEGFLILAVLIVVLVMVLRHLRQREVDAFKGEDMKALRDFVATNGVTSNGDGADLVPLVDVEELTAKYPDLVKAENLKPVAGPVYLLKKAAVDEIHRTVLEVLVNLLGDSVRVLVQVPLTNFVRTETSDTALFGRHISFLVCSKQNYSVLFGLQLKGSGGVEASDLSFLMALFDQIERPLFTLPMVSGISKAEISAALEPVLQSPGNESFP